MKPDVKGNPLYITVYLLVASYIIGEFILPKYPFEETNGNRYLILNIAELNSTIYGTNNALTQAFAILVPDKEYVEVFVEDSVPQPPGVV